METATPSTANHLVTRFLSCRAALLPLLREYGPLRCHGYTLAATSEGQIDVRDFEMPGYPHASSVDRPAPADCAVVGGPYPDLPEEAA